MNHLQQYNYLYKSFLNSNRIIENFTKKIILFTLIEYMTPVAKVLRQICYIYISHQRDRFFFLSLSRDRALKELQFNIQQII